MKIINTPPPNWADIQKVFPVRWSDEVIVTYYPNVHCVTDDISVAKEVHEGVHLIQQKKMGVELWWKTYLTDPKFCMIQEVEAYKAEAEYVKQHYSREARRRHLRHIVDMLSSKMYNNFFTREEAEKLIA